jgi:hypothetical protein
MFRNVQVRVFEQIRQEPWLDFGYLRKTYLAPRRAVKVSPVQSSPRPPLSEAAQAWALIKESTDLSMLEAFRAQYGPKNPLYDRLAEKRLASLRPATSNPVAAKVSGGSAPDREASAATISGRASARMLQEELARVGCDPGAVDGIWGKKSSRSMALFNQYAGTKFDINAPSMQALDTLRRKKSNVCPHVDATLKSSSTPTKQSTTKARVSKNEPSAVKQKRASKKKCTFSRCLRACHEDRLPRPGNGNCAMLCGGYYSFETC